MPILKKWLWSLNALRVKLIVIFFWITLLVIFLSAMRHSNLQRTTLWDGLASVIVDPRVWKIALFGGFVSLIGCSVLALLFVLAAEFFAHRAGGPPASQ
jgi:hypothetical protein